MPKYENFEDTLNIPPVPLCSDNLSPFCSFTVFENDLVHSLLQCSTNDMLNWFLFCISNTLTVLGLDWAPGGLNTAYYI